MTPAGCARCHRDAVTAATWPDGRICRACIGRAARTRGRCPSCGATRLLPGLAAGETVCRDCAGITRDFTCSRCGIEGLLTAGRICERCALTARLSTVLDDGSGQPAPRLQPLAEALAAMPRPTAGIAWLRNRSCTDLLTAVATGTTALSHEALAAWPNRRAAAHLRDLLTGTGILPERDPALAAFESWLHHRLGILAGHPQLSLLRRYATFTLLARMRTAPPGTLVTGSAKTAVREFASAQAFCDWLQDTGIPAAGITQARMDRWHAGQSRTTAKAARGFLTFAMRNGAVPRLALPSYPVPDPSIQPVSAARRLALIRRALTDTSGPPRTRAAALLVLLFAQPASRITRLTLDDISQDSAGLTFLRLGDPPVPVPEPLAVLLRQAAASGSPSAAGTTTGPRWLFPGQSAGRPLSTGTLAQLLNQYGIPIAAARTAAFRALVQQAPAPVIAQALGYSGNAAAQNAAAAGDTWSRYATGDHTR